MKGKYKKPNKVPWKHHKKHEIPPPPPPLPPPPLIKKKLELKEIRNQQHMFKLSQDYSRIVLLRSNLFQSFFHVYIAGFKVPISIKYFPYQNLTEHKPKDPRGSPMSGGFGTCIFIKEPKNQQAKCLKITYFKDTIEDKNQQYFYLQDFIREVGICKIASQHEFGPKTYQILQFDILVYKNCMCFLMEKCEPLLKRIQEIHGDELLKQKQKVIKDLFLCCEKKKPFHIIHRDIKESNTAYCHRLGRYILIDFGISHCVQENENEESKIKMQGGTEGYVMNLCLLPGYINNQKINLYQNDEYAVKIVQKKLKTHTQSQSDQFINKQYDIKDVTFELKQSQQKDQQKDVLDFVKIIYGYSYLTHCLWQQYIAKSCPEEQIKVQKLDQKDFKSRFGINFYSSSLNNIQNIVIQIGKGTDYHIRQEAKFSFQRMEEIKSIDSTNRDAEIVQLRCLRFLGGQNNKQIMQMLSKFSEQNNIQVIKTLKAIISIHYKDILKENQRKVQDIGEILYQDFVNKNKNKEQTRENSQILLLFLVDHINKLFEKKSKKEDFLKQHLRIFKEKKAEIIKIHERLLRKKGNYYKFKTLMLYCTIIRKQLKYSFFFNQHVNDLIRNALSIYQNLMLENPKTYRCSTYLGILSFYYGTVNRADPTKLKYTLNANLYAFQILGKHFTINTHYSLQINQNLSQIYKIQKNSTQAQKYKKRAYLAVFQTFDYIEILRMKFSKDNIPNNQHIKAFNQKLVESIRSGNNFHWQTVTMWLQKQSCNKLLKILFKNCSFNKGPKRNMKQFFEASQKYFPYSINNTMANNEMRRKNEKKKLADQCFQLIHKFQIFLQLFENAKQRCSNFTVSLFHQFQKQLRNRITVYKKYKNANQKHCKRNREYHELLPPYDIKPILREVEQNLKTLIYSIPLKQNVKELSLQECSYLELQYKFKKIEKVLERAEQFLEYLSKIVLKNPTNGPRYNNDKRRGKVCSTNMH